MTIVCCFWTFTAKVIVDQKDPFKKTPHFVTCLSLLNFLCGIKVSLFAAQLVPSLQCVDVVILFPFSKGCFVHKKICVNPTLNSVLNTESSAIVPKSFGCESCFAHRVACDAQKVGVVECLCQQQRKTCIARSVESRFPLERIAEPTHCASTRTNLFKSPFTVNPSVSEPLYVMVGKTLTLTVHCPPSTLLTNPISLSWLHLHPCPHRELRGFSHSSVGLLCLSCDRWMALFVNFGELVPSSV